MCSAEVGVFAILYNFYAIYYTNNFAVKQNKKALSKSAKREKLFYWLLDYPTQSRVSHVIDNLNYKQCNKTCHSSNFTNHGHHLPNANYYAMSPIDISFQSLDWMGRDKIFISHF
jgi:hypothetical protein